MQMLQPHFVQRKLLHGPEQRVLHVPLLAKLSWRDGEHFPKGSGEGFLGLEPVLDGNIYDPLVGMK
ncbi:hypothetical protein D3C78_1877200 [compost metagenome]